MQAAITQPRQINREHDVPYLAGSSNAGGVTYIDRSIPPKVKIGRKNVDVAKYLNIHEQTEHALMIEGKMPYEAAHRIATEHEIAAVKADGINVQKYNDFMAGHLKKTEAEVGKPVNPPPDLYTKPYPHNEAEILAHEQAGAHTPASAPAGDVEAAVRDAAHQVHVAAAASPDPRDHQIGKILEREVVPFIDEAFPKTPVAAESAERPLDEKVQAETLLAFLKRLGGVQDEGGSLKAQDWIKGYPGLINNKRGLSLDAAREAAAEAGYLGGDTKAAMENTHGLGFAGPPGEAPGIFRARLRRGRSG